MRHRYLLPIFALAFLVGVLTGCASDGVGGPPRLVNLELVDQATFDRVTDDAVRDVDTYLGLAYEHGIVDEDDLRNLATALDAIAAGQIQPIPGGPISEALADQGWTDREVRAAFDAVDRILSLAGVRMSWGVSPRLSAFLGALAAAVRAIGPADPSNEA
jgi:hypothetical protein